MSYDHSISKCLIGCLLIFSILAMGASVTLVTLLAIWGYIGFIGTAPFPASACTDVYFSNKYSDMTIFNEIVFVGGSLSSIMSILIFIIALSWARKSCKGPFCPSNWENGCIFFVASLMVLGSIAPSGYYLNLLLQYSKCTFNSDSSQIFLILILGGCSLIIGLFTWLIILCLNCCRSQVREQTYKQVDNTLQTQQNQETKHKYEPKKYPEYKEEKYARRSPEKTHQQNQPPSNTQKYEYTKQQFKINVFDSPSKKRIESYNSNNLEPIYLGNKLSRENQQPLRDSLLVPTSKDPYQVNVVKNLHPSLRDNPSNSVQKNKKTIDYLGDDLQKLHKQQGKYLNMDRRGILSSRGLQQRQRKNERNRQGRNFQQSLPKRDENQITGYFLPFNPPKRQVPHPGERQGILHKYIRGRYKN